MTDVTLYVGTNGRTKDTPFARGQGARQKAECDHDWTVIERKSGTELRHCSKCRKTSRRPMEAK